MRELGIKEFVEVTVDKLNELKTSKVVADIVLENPRAGSKFPEVAVQSPLKYIERTKYLIRFSIIVEAWAKKKYDSYDIADKIDNKLNEYNFLKTSTPIDFFDEITGTYRYGGSYEVLFNVLTNTFEKIK